MDTYVYYISDEAHIIYVADYKKGEAMRTITMISLYSYELSSSLYLEESGSISRVKNGVGKMGS